MKQIYMQAIDALTSKIDTSVCSDGLNFLSNEICLLICNHPIYKGERSYFEFEVSSYDVNTAFKNIPLYVGIHKDPSTGVLANDFSLGSIFYKTGGDYDIMEKHNETASTNHSVPPHIYTRTPGATDTIGVAVDSINNLITIYVEGKPFYSFTPSLFNIKNEDPFYFCIYGNIAANIRGVVNFGRFGVKYLPIGYITAFAAHNKSKVSNEFTGSVTVIHSDTAIAKDLNGYVTVDAIKGTGDLSLNPSTALTTVTKDVNFYMPKTYGQFVSSNLPIPANIKIYTEFYVRDAVNADDTIGIPICIGLTNSKDIYNSISVTIPLYHKQWHPYEYYQTVANVKSTTYVKNAMTSVPNVEGKTVGLGFDLKNNKITVWVDKVLFNVYKITDFDANRNGLFMMLFNGGVFSNYINGVVNFGAAEETDAATNPFKMDIPDGYMSLWHYYNKTNLLAVPNMPELAGTVTIIDKYTVYNKHLLGTVYVEESPNGDAAKFRTGINRLMNTYNTLTDTKAHNVDGRFKSPSYLNGLIALHNNFYYPDDVFGTLDISQFRTLDTWMSGSVTVV